MDRPTKKLNKSFEALRESEGMFRALVENTTDYTLVIGSDGIIKYASPAVAQTSGYSPEEIIGQNFEKFSPPDDRDTARAAFKQVRQSSGQSVHVPRSKLRKKNGQVVYYEVLITDMSQIDGVEGVVVHMRDIAERVVAEQIVTERESELRAITNLSPVGIFRSNRMGELTYVSDRWCEIMGREGDAALADGWVSCMHPEDRGRATKAWQKFADGDEENYQVDCRIIQPDGSVVWLISQAAKDYGENGEFLGCSGSITDITKQKSAEQALAVSEERFALAMRGANDGIWDWNLDAESIYCSPRGLEMLGYDDGELPGTNNTWVELLHPDDRPRVLESVINCVNDRSATYDMEVRLRHKDGHYADVHTRGFAVFDDDGHVGRIVGTNSDISRRKRAEAALTKSEERFSLAMQGANDGLWDWNLKTGEVYNSPRWFEMIGYQPGELSDTREDWVAMMHPDDHLKLAEFQANFVRDDAMNYDMDVRMRHKEGHYVDILSRVIIVRDDDGFPIRMIGTNTDITDRKKAESEVLMAKEQAEAANQAKSEFLSSMSHELRTPMNAILGYSQLLGQVDAEPLSENQKIFVDEILRSGSHMLELIGNVLDLAKIESGDVPLDMEDCDPKPLIMSCLKMVGGLAAQNNIAVGGDCSEHDLPMIRVDALRFKQVLLNVLSNAVKYNQPNGEVSLACNLEAEGQLRIIVTDTGDGIADYMRDKVFEPFDRLGAETSNIGGTGIGMSVSKEFIESMGGGIGFESTPGKGSTFWIDVPIAAI